MPSSRKPSSSRNGRTVHHSRDAPYTTNPSTRKKRVSVSSPLYSNPNLRPFVGYFTTTGHALCLIQAARNGLIPFRMTRLADNERPCSGSVYVFESGSAGVQRWTDNFAWSPTRLSAECMVYREITESLPEHFIPDEDRPEVQEYQQRIKPLVSSHFDGTVVTVKKKSGNKDVFITPGGLVKRVSSTGALCLIELRYLSFIFHQTFTITADNSCGLPHEYHVIGYLSIDDWLSGALISPFEHPLIGPLIQNIDQDLLQTSCFKRCPPRICSVNGRLRYISEVGPDSDPLSATTWPSLPSNVLPASAPAQTYTSYTVTPSYSSFTPGHSVPLSVHPAGYPAPYSTWPVCHYSHQKGLPSFLMNVSCSWDGPGSQAGYYYMLPAPIRMDSFVSDLASEPLSSCSIGSPRWMSGSGSISPAHTSFASSPRSYSSPSSLSPYRIPASRPFSFDSLNDNANLGSTIATFEDYQTAGISPALISPSTTISPLLPDRQDQM
ncbi:hypothetical protein FRB93_010166 [Tulasnella sp. JGI-2019a]|nr:hypothetical protein FRB93_010166 [Tulasnella sp. JGI-2019a]